MFTPGMPSVRPEPLQQQYQHEPQRVHQQAPLYQDSNDELRRSRDYQQNLADPHHFNSQKPQQPQMHHPQTTLHHSQPLQPQPQPSLLNKDWSDKPFDRPTLSNQTQQSKMYSEQLQDSNSAQTSSQQYPSKTFTSTYSSQPSQQVSQPSWSQQPDSFSEQPPRVSSYQDDSSMKLTPLSSSGFYSQPSSALKTQLTSDLSNSSRLSNMVIISYLAVYSNFSVLFLILQ